MIKEVYLDNAATTKPYDEVIEYISEINRNFYGNPSSLHKKGLEAEMLVKKARGQISSSLGVSISEIYFTSGGTESNNLAIMGYLEANPRSGRHIITTKIEHPSVLEVYKHLEKKGYKVDYLDVMENGKVDIEDLKKKLSGDTSLISLIYVNNEIGTVQPVYEIADMVKGMNINTVIHLDAVQAFGKVKINPKKIGIGLMSFSSHKIHGPKGIGALYVDKKIKIKPVLYGGGQESAIRSGTENVSGIGGFGLASELISRNIEENLENVRGLKEYFIEKLAGKTDGYSISSPFDSTPYIINVSFEGIHAEVLLHHLEELNVYVSTGSACSSRKNLHSHVLKAIGLKPTIIEGSIRFSLSGFTTKDEIDYTVNCIEQILPKIRKKPRR